MRTTHPFALLAIVVLVSLPVPEICAEDVIRMDWAVLHDTDEGVKALDFSTIPEIEKGSTLQLYLHPDTQTYVYILLVDSSNRVIPVFPSTPGYYDNNSAGEEIRIPAGRNRFTIVPPPGEEKFYLLASSDRLDDLEDALEQCLRRPEDKNIQARLYDEIRTLRRRHSSMRQLTEKGMPVSGTTRRLEGTRSIDTGRDFHVTRVTTDGFYSRILRLRHD